VTKVQIKRRAGFAGLLCFALAGCGAGPSGSHLGGGGGSAPSASTVATGPQLGYVWDSAAQALRPELGVPGASQIGAPLTPAGYVFAAASPRSAVAVLLAKDGSLETQALPNGAPTLINGASAPLGSRAVFSPSGNNALLYAPGNSAVTLVTGLTSAPQAQTLHAPTNLLGAAVSDTALVAVVAGSGTLKLTLLGGNGAALATLSGFGGINFLPSGDDLLTADAAANSVVLVRHSSTAPVAQTIAAPQLKAPVDIAASRDGRWAIVANGGDASIARLDLTGQTPALRIACACQPNQLAALNGNAVFRITSLTAGPTWLVDASSAAPKTLFIPAAHSAGGQP
jgi:hypothetical protein